jgi:integrase
VTAFKSALIRGVAWRLVDAHIVMATRPPKVESTRIEVPDADEIATLISVAPDDLRAAIIVDVGSGLRRSELLALTWRDFDPQRNTLAVRRSLERRVKEAPLPEYKGTKTGRERNVSLPAFAVEALRRHRLAQAERFLKYGFGRPHADTPIFDRLGEVWHPERFSQRFYQFIKHAGVLKITFHGLRHAYASHLLAAGVHPKIASEALGHSRIGITMDLYSHAAANLQDEAVIKLEGALGSSISSTFTRENGALSEVM